MTHTSLLAWLFLQTWFLKCKSRFHSLPKHRPQWGHLKGQYDKCLRTCSSMLKIRCVLNFPQIRQDSSWIMRPDLGLSTITLPMCSLKMLRSTCLTEAHCLASSSSREIVFSVALARNLSVISSDYWSSSASAPYLAASRTKKPGKLSALPLSIGNLPCFTMTFLPMCSAWLFAI